MWGMNMNGDILFDDIKSIQSNNTFVIEVERQNLTSTKLT